MNCSGHLGLVGPELVVGLGDEIFGVREMPRAVVGHAPAAVIDVGMAHHHRVDVLRIDPGLLQAVHQLAGGRPEQVERAETGIEQHELVAGVEHQGVLLEHGIVVGQKIVAQLLVHLLGGQAEEIGMRVAERQGAVGHDRGLGAAQLEAVEIGRLGAEHRRPGERGLPLAGAERAQRPRSRCPDQHAAPRQRDLRHCHLPDGSCVTRPGVDPRAVVPPDGRTVRPFCGAVNWVDGVDLCCRPPDRSAGCRRSEGVGGRTKPTLRHDRIRA